MALGRERDKAMKSVDITKGTIKIPKSVAFPDSSPIKKCDQNEMPCSPCGLRNSNFPQSTEVHFLQVSWFAMRSESTDTSRMSRH